MLPNELVRTPRLLVLANGVPLMNAMDATVTSTGAFAADWFYVRAALAGDAARWAAASPVRVDVQISLTPQSGFVSLIQGDVDAVSIDPLQGTLTLEGRDLSAALIEAPSQEVFANQTSSEIATVLAGRHGLSTDVQATATPVGRYWQLEHDKLTLNAGSQATTEWDLLATLAQHEGFDLWVAGETLHFRAPDVSAPPTILSASRVSALRLDRALTFAGDIIVTVKSWHSRAGSSCVQTVQTERDSPSSKTYVFVVPNLTPQSALALAQQRLQELTGHELSITAEMPGELGLQPRGWLHLQGTGTAFDTRLRIDEVERQLHAKHGFLQIVRAHAPTGG